jgi:predicted RecA/RadA family phage recombinase
MNRVHGVGYNHVAALGQQALNRTAKQGTQGWVVLFAAHKVIGASHDCHQVGLERKGIFKLSGQNLQHVRAAKRKVGKVKVFASLMSCSTQKFGQPVSPTTAKSAHLKVKISEALSQRISDCHIAAVEIFRHLRRLGQNWQSL